LFVVRVIRLAVTLSTTPITTSSASTTVSPALKCKVASTASTIIVVEESAP